MNVQGAQHEGRAKRAGSVPLLKEQHTERTSGTSKGSKDPLQFQRVTLKTAKQLRVGVLFGVAVLIMLNFRLEKVYGLKLDYRLMGLTTICSFFFMIIAATPYVNTLLTGRLRMFMNGFIILTVAAATATIILLVLRYEQKNRIDFLFVVLPVILWKLVLLGALWMLNQTASRLTIQLCTIYYTCFAVFLTIVTYHIHSGGTSENFRVITVAAIIISFPFLYHYVALMKYATDEPNPVFGRKLKLHMRCILLMILLIWCDVTGLMDFGPTITLIPIYFSVYVFLGNLK
jgi:hypothetical protein